MEFSAEQRERASNQVRDYKAAKGCASSWPVAVDLQCQLNMAIALLADVMHLWVDSYISKDPNSCADDAVSSSVFDKIESFLGAQGIAVDYCGWHYKGGLK